MLSVSNLLCDHRAGNESLRYSHTRRAHHSRHDLLQGDALPDEAPRPVVVWALTKACNLRCVHCYASAEPNAAPGELTHDQGRALLEDLAAFGVPAVLFSGGEPLVRPDALQLIEYARSLGLSCTLSTNGVLIDDAMADQLHRVGLKYVGISLDGGQAIHDKLRGMRGAFAGSLAAIDRCRARGIKVGLRYTVHGLNHQDLDEIIDLCLAHDVQRLCIYHLAYAGRGDKMRKVDLTAEQTRAIVDRIFHRTARLHEQGYPLEVLTVGNHADAGYLLTRLERDDPDRAQSVRRRLEGTGGNQSGSYIASIDPLGNVHYDQFSWHYTCGNVREQPFSVIWSQAMDQRLAILRNRRDHLPPRCRGCRFLDVCNGNLRTRAEAATGNWLAMDPACYLTDEEIQEEIRGGMWGDMREETRGAVPRDEAAGAPTPAATSDSSPAIRTIVSRVTNPPLELNVSDQAFLPNPTTVRFSRAVTVQPGELVFDIGTGVGPLALMAAKAGARRVIGVDPVPLHVQLAKQNVAKYGMEEIVQIYQGRFFEPFDREPSLRGLRADVIIGDVSGIADAVARALGWYSDAVPTGGYDGTQVIIDFLKQAPGYLAPGGRVYFPIAVDLADGQKILDAVHTIFSHAENALGRPYVEFPLTPEQVRMIHDAYHGEPPPFIRVQSGARPYWRGQIWIARQPRDA